MGGQPGYAIAVYCLLHRRQPKFAGGSATTAQHDQFGVEYMDKDSYAPAYIISSFGKQFHRERVAAGSCINDNIAGFFKRSKTKNWFEEMSRKVAN